MSFILSSILIGAGATALFDLWGILVARLRGTPRPEWGLAGRWFGHVARGRLVHDDIAASPAIPAETALGWIGHYLIGILYAAAVLVIWGMDWARTPTLAPALIVGIVTIAAGWFVMSPGMGGGWAASRSDAPWTNRALGLAAHVVFGIGLYLSALLVSGLVPPATAG